MLLADRPANDEEAATAPPAVADAAPGAAAPGPDRSLFGDIPAGIWKVFLAAWATFFGLMALFFATTAEAAFMVTVVCLFAAMAFGLPMAMAAQAGGARRDHRGVVETLTGPLAVGAAGVQIALIPVAVVFGLVAFIVLAKP